MRSSEERIKQMHNRVSEMKKKHDKRVLVGMGSLSAILCLVLILYSVHVIGAPGAITDTAMAGSSLLSENAGGYVLVAVVSFSLAVLVTTALIKAHLKK